MCEEKMKTSRIYAGNLPFAITDDTLRELFSEAGEVVEARVIIDRSNDNRSKGFGFVTMLTDAEGLIAVKTLDGRVLDGRTIKVSVARERERA